MFRVLHEPTPETGVSTIAVSATPPATATTHVPATTPTPPPPATITVRPEEYQQLQQARARLAEVDAQTQRDRDAAETERLRLLAEKGEAVSALTQLRESKDREIQAERDRATTIEGELLTDRKAVVIQAALVGIDWVNDQAAADASTILAGRFEAVRDAAGAILVRERGTNRTAAEVIKEWRESAGSSHFQKAATQGGTGARGGSATTPTPPASPFVPTIDPAKLTLGEKYVAVARISRGLTPFAEPQPGKLQIHGGLVPRLN